MDPNVLPALVEEIATWGATSDEAECVRMKSQLLACYLAEISGAVVTEVLIAVAKALEAGYYLGKYGFPDERVPDAFKDAFKDELDTEGGS